MWCARRLRNLLTVRLVVLREVCRRRFLRLQSAARALSASQTGIGTQAQDHQAPNPRRQLHSNLISHLPVLRLGAGSFFKGSLPSLGAMSSSQSLRRLAANQAVVRPASLLRSTPTTSKCLLRSSMGVRSLSSHYFSSYSPRSILQPLYTCASSCVRDIELTFDQETSVHYTVTTVQSIKSV